MVFAFLLKAEKEKSTPFFITFIIFLRGLGLALFLMQRNDEAVSLNQAESRT